MAERFLTPQQIDFLAYYTDPRSETYSSAMKSAIKAGFSESYADNITSQMPDWLCESIGDDRRLKLAERRLDQILNLEPVDEEGKIDNSLIANQMKAINLVTKGIGKAKYSERQEHTGANGGAIEVNNITELSDDELLRISSESGTS